MQKIKDEQLKKLQDFINAINQGQIQLGGLDIQKHQLLHQISEVQETLNKFQIELEEEYGKVSINVQDGSYKEIKENESSTED